MTATISQGRRADAARRAPRATLIRGHHGLFRADKLGFLTGCAREYGDAVPLRFAYLRAWLVSSPAMIGEVLATRAASFKKDMGLRRMRVLLGDGLLTSEGAAHGERSRVAQPAFRQQEVERYAEGMVELSQRVVASWRDGARIDLSVELSRLTLAAVGRALFGADLLGEASAIGDALTEMLEILEARVNSALPLPLSIPTCSNRRLLRVRDVLDDAVLRLIAERRASGAPGGDAGGVPPRQGADLLSRLLAAPALGGRGLDDRALRDEVMTLLLAGHETTANALTFSLFLLAKHPDALARARAEVESALHGRPAQAADAAHMPFLGQVFAEALRLYPPAWMLGREAVEDITLGDGLRVRRGDHIMMSPFIVQRDPRWFPDPLAFRPERFAREAARLAPWTYFPFGGGKRACIGRSFALIEASMILATILPAVDLEIDTARDPDLLPQITLRPAHGMPAIVRRRARAG